MALRDNLNPELKSKSDVRDSDEKITIYLWEHSSWVEVQGYHDSVFAFIRHAVSIFWDVAEEINCSTWEKLILLNDWLDDMEKLKDKWMGDLIHKEEDD